MPMVIWVICALKFNSINVQLPIYPYTAAGETEELNK